MDDLRPGWWMTAHAWLEDGDIWTAHDCMTERVVTRLPHPKWHLTADGTEVEPSFHCLDCGCHAFLKIETHPYCETCGRTDWPHDHHLERRLAEEPQS